MLHVFLLEMTPVSFIDLEMEQIQAEVPPHRDALLGALKHPPSVTPGHHLKGSDAGDVEQFRKYANSGVYCLVQSLGTGTGPKIWEIHFSWLLSGHHLHKSDYGQGKNHKFPVFQ